MKKQSDYTMEDIITTERTLLQLEREGSIAFSDTLPCIDEVLHSIKTAIKKDRPPIELHENNPMQNIMTIMQLASESQEWPKIRLQMPDGSPLVLSYNKKKHWINVSNGKVSWDDNNIFYGKIAMKIETIDEGKAPIHYMEYMPVHGMARQESNAIRSIIVAFGMNPMQSAKMYSNATCNCSFCGRHLTNQNSIAVGYGPICAANFGLQWGKE